MASALSNIVCGEKKGVIAPYLAPEILSDSYGRLAKNKIQRFHQSPSRSRPVKQGGGIPFDIATNLYHDLAILPYLLLGCLYQENHFNRTFLHWPDTLSMLESGKRHIQSHDSISAQLVPCCEELGESEKPTPLCLAVTDDREVQ